MSGVDMYSEPGLSTLRQMVKDEPEWAVNRLLADRARIAALEAENAELRQERDEVLLRLFAAKAMDPASPGAQQFIASLRRRSAPSPDAKEATG